MSAERPPGIIKRSWHALRRPSATYSLLALLVVGFFVGIAFWGGLHAGIEATNTLEFCTSCHEMHDTVFQEYKETIHFTNRTGVRATCSDCHVPKDWAHKMVRKVKATGEIWGKLTGVIATKEKFEARRMEMATSEWNQMKASGSRECRNCHNFDSMDARRQKPTAQQNHSKAKAEGKTCIDCHKGIAHLLPKEYKEDDE